MPMWLNAQKNCQLPKTGWLPLPELTGTFKGYPGMLYPNSNTPQGDYLINVLKQARDITPLDVDGNASSSGKIVMAGVGASNPRTEFEAFEGLLSQESGLRSELVTVNTCIGGQGVQKMNLPEHNYWKSALKQFDSLGLSFQQVQILWLETENTQVGDTQFPSAPHRFEKDLLTLLQTLKTLFPNAKLCYLSARAWTGWVEQDSGASVGKGLLHPRDYYNGFAIKWLIDSANQEVPGYRYMGNQADIVMPLYGSYHWTDGETPQSDGFYLDCETDIGGDGLHLSATGEQKVAQKMLSFFKSDTAASIWMYANTASISYPRASAKIYPNPSRQAITIELPGNSTFQVVLRDISGKTLLYLPEAVSNSELNLAMIPAGIYWISIQNENYSTTEKLIHLGN